MALFTSRYNLRIVALALAAALPLGACSSSDEQVTEPVATPDAEFAATADVAPPAPEEPAGSLTDEPVGPPSDVNVPSGSSTYVGDLPPAATTAPTPSPASSDNMEYESPDSPPEAGKVTRYVKATLLNVRSSPNAKAPVVRRLLGGSRISVEIHGKYAKIKEGQWVRTRYLSAKPTKKVSRSDADKAWKKPKKK